LIREYALRNYKSYQPGQEKNSKIYQERSGKVLEPRVKF
jgi:hypothetical protein